MIKNILAIAFACYQLSVTFVHSSASTTYTVFALQYKPQVCYKSTTPNCYKAGVPNITIHGIWTNAYSGSHPAYCGGAQLKKSDVSGIENKLNLNWPTLKGSNTNYEFWAYEYDKHGTCWDHIVKKKEYFTIALWMLEEDGYKFIQEILELNGIYPSSSKLYKLKDVTNTLSDALNQKIIVQCNNNKYINEFFICRDWYGKKMDCPTSLTSNCNSKVILSFQVPHYSYEKTLVLS